MKKRYITILIIGIVIILIIVSCILINKKDKVSENNIENVKQENNIEKNDYNETTIYNATVNATSEEIEEIKNSINAEGNTDIYQVEQESDGRKYLQVKPNVQFYVDLAGIIKKAKPEENELNNLVSQAPTKNGVWISEQSRKIFSELLQDNNIINIGISDDGYLKINNTANNDLEKGLEKMINSDKIYYINMTGIAYQRDYISGQIQEYPFEDMDPEQVLESFEDENKLILELSTNKMNKLTNKEILETIIRY